MHCPRTTRSITPSNRSLSSRFEELGRIPISIFQLDLSASRTDLHLIAKPHPDFLERVDPRSKIGHAQDHSIPPARLLGLTARHRTRSRCSRSTEQQYKPSERDTGECGELLMFQLEAEMVRVERDRPGDILHLIAHAVHADYALRVVHHSLLRLRRRMSGGFPVRLNLAVTVTPRNIVLSYLCTP